MKASNVREMSYQEQSQALTDLKQELFNLRFQHGVGQLENPVKMGAVKRDIARVLTIMQETENKQS